MTRTKKQPIESGSPVPPGLDELIESGRDRGHVSEDDVDALFEHLEERRTQPFSGGHHE